MTFFRVLFDCPVCEGYGQSESTGVVTLTDVEDVSMGTVGAPLSSVEIKLVSVPDMGYEVTDTVHGDDKNKIPVNGRGEVCYRGPTIFLGYYNADGKTADAVDKDGWLHSGDIGCWTLDGRLKIVDRKKNIFKLSQGEYVAPEKIENTIKTSPYVAQPFVYGDSLHSILVGIIVPKESALKTLAGQLQVSGFSIAEVCANPKVTTSVVVMCLQVVGVCDGCVVSMLDCRRSAQGYCGRVQEIALEWL
jgi:long-chain acyl-CoA synthetase